MPCLPQACIAWFSVCFMCHSRVLGGITGRKKRVTTRTLPRKKSARRAAIGDDMTPEEAAAAAVAQVRPPVQAGCDSRHLMGPAHKAALCCAVGKVIIGKQVQAWPAFLLAWFPAQHHSRESRLDSHRATAVTSLAADTQISIPSPIMRGNLSHLPVCVTRVRPSR